MINDRDQDVDRPESDLMVKARATARRRRRRLLLGSIPVLLLVLLFSIKTLSMVAVNESGRGAYVAGDNAAAESRFGRLGVLNVFQWWIAPYNRGTARYQTGDLDGSVEQLKIALGRAPQEKKCQVATNLARTQEAQGDQMASEGRQADAQERYKSALQVLADNRCAGSEQGAGDQQQKDQQQKQEKQKQAEERVSKKLEKSESQPEGKPNEEQGDPQQQPERTPEQQQRRTEEQKKRNGDAQRQQQEQRDRKDSEANPGGGQVDKPW